MKALKEPLRREMRARLRSEATGLPTRSALIRRQIRSLPFWGSARTVGLFCPLPGEPDLLPLMEEEGRRFVFPRIEGVGLAWHEVGKIAELEATQTRGMEHLRQPAGGVSLPTCEIELLLVPGLAFTRAGGRLGRGGGYYDRVLAELETGARSVGVCFEFQILEELPLEDHDMRVHRVCAG